MHIRLINIILIVLVVMLQACSLTKGLPTDVKVVRSVKVDLELADEKKNNKKLKAELSDIVLFSPASGLDKSRVYIYNNTNKKGKEKGLAYWIQNSIGQAPEIYKQRLLETSRARMKKLLLDQGHFSSKVKADTAQVGQLVDIKFQAYSAGRYQIDSVYGLSDSLFMGLTRRQKALLNLRKSKYYEKSKLDILRSESVNRLRSRGYFNIDENQFYFYVDTIPGNKEVDIYFQFADPNASGEKIYRYQNVDIYPDYSLGKTSISLIPSFREDNLRIYQDSSVFKPKLFTRLVKKDSAGLYNPKADYELISRLRATGVFKFVNLNYDTLSIGGDNFINRKVNLTPGLMRDVGFEFQVNTTNGNALGSEISTSYQHLNIFGGAEKLKLKAALGGEFLTSSSTQQGVFNTYDIVISSSLSFPGLLGFGKNRFLSRGPTIPRTTFNLSNQFQDRNSFYRINSTDFTYTYSIGTPTENHKLTPISIDYVNVLRREEALDSLFMVNPRLAESLTDVFIFATNYVYYHASPQPSKKKGGYYYSFQGGLESAGALLNLISSGGNKDPKTIFSVPFSQYIKGDIDFLPKYAIGDHMLAGRVSVGLGIPYGNSKVLPYIKQYFVGGASSLRAFDIRTLGPGSYTTSNTATGTNFLDQTGDIKLELNLEYRFPVFSYLKGALFIDAGNVWLAENSLDSVNLDLGVFDFKNFYKELGVGGGLGIRLDFDITVLRLDIATPFYDPRNQQGWSLKDWNKNLKYRIGIGYPF